jgi:very-short-patch-repair endonuclease
MALAKRPRSTKIEDALEILLIALKVPYEKQKPLLNMTLADFFIEPDLVVYADGDYWHSRPEVKKRDFRITKALIDAGYRVLRFSESTIYEKINNVKQELSNACR